VTTGGGSDVRGGGSQIGGGGAKIRLDPPNLIPEHLDDSFTVCCRIFCCRFINSECVLQAGTDHGV